MALVSLAKLHPFNAHIWKSPSPKSLFVDKYENDTHAHANDTLFINKIAGILEKYGMYTPMELLINPPSKHMGKTMIKKAINEYWYTKYNEEKSTKTTIRHLEIQKEPIGTPHNI